MVTASHINDSRALLSVAIGARHGVNSMERMIKDLRDGETEIFANNSNEYERFTNWLCDNRGAVFAYHFETGEGYRLPNGRHVEVYGL